jgi:hypothetical protein
VAMNAMDISPENHQAGDGQRSDNVMTPVFPTMDVLDRFWAIGKPCAAACR